MSKAKSRTINTIIWEDEKFETFSPDEKWFWTTILINPSSNNLGAYKLTILRLQRLLGYDKITIENMLYRFMNNYEMIKYDFETQEILILNWSKYNWTTSPTYKSNLLKLIEKIDSETIKKDLELILRDFYGKEKIKQEVVVKGEVPFGVDLGELFNMFWKAYPKKQGKGNAEAWFKRHRPNEQLVFEMIKAIEKFKQTSDWKKDNGQFIPHPTTWLNGKRWLDEIPTVEDTMTNRWESFLND